MKVLLLGASGFIGSAIADNLLAGGHQVRALGRDLAYGRRILRDAEWAYCDLRRGAEWPALLSGVSVVINASGALQSGLRDDVGQVQEHAVAALVQACRTAGIAQFIQISAAGAGRQTGPFMQTKARADALLAESGVPHTIIRPGLVIGRNGFGGTELLRAAAGMPVGLVLSGAGTIQTAALADVIAAVRRVIAEPARCAGCFDLLESQPRSLGDIIAVHRAWLGLPPPRLTITMPIALLRPITLLADALGWLGWRSPLRSNAVAALTFGVSGDAAQARALLGCEPLSLPETLAQAGQAGKADRWHARIAPVYPLALAALVVLWLAGGIIGLARLNEAAALLGQTPAARAAVIGGSLADIAIALGIIYRPTLRPALLASSALAAAYVIGAALVRPDLWLDPLGAMVKVIPIIALSLLCHAMAEER
jgi:uncharacterized protein YbjT (DUF2867 family)